MIIQREEFYFEPRCISDYGSIRWFGETLTDKELLKHCEETVYIRDNGSEIYIYRLESDDWNEDADIKAMLTLICKIKKARSNFTYGRKLN